MQWLRVLTTKDKVHLSGHEKNPAPVSLLSGSAGILQVKNLDLFINFFLGGNVIVYFFLFFKRS